MNIQKTIALSLITSIALFSPILAQAAPVGIPIEVRCPNPANPEDLLANYGDFIAGYGTEIIPSQPKSAIFFKSDSSINQVPVDLSHYSNRNVEYNSSTGTVSCSYYSNMGEKSFNVAYTLTNGKGGRVMQSNNESVTITIPLGLKA